MLRDSISLKELSNFRQHEVTLEENQTIIK